MSIILSSINRVACNDIFKGEQPSDRVGPVPPRIYAYEYYLNEIECIPVESFTDSTHGVQLIHFLIAGQQ